MNDQAQRQQALHPSESFIVQAPAGSGKTELLIQRYLRLLANVNQPEEIMALTFTKKAANEMRERLITALEQAVHVNTADNHHKKITEQLAKEVLKRDASKQWQLLKNPNRLKIQTIDALNYRLNTQLPIVSGLGFSPSISNNPKPLYQQAIHALFKGLETDASWRKPLATLLLHLDNQYALVENLLINLLEKRDQWLPHIFNEEKNQRRHLEQALININQETLDKLEKMFSAKDKAVLKTLLDFSREHLEKDPLMFNDDSVETHADSYQKLFWLAVVDLLLTQDNSWRKQLNKINGFPSKLDDKIQEKKSKALKEEALSFIASCKARKNIQALLVKVRLLPPCQYSDKQWEIIETLMELLPIACAQLNLTFAEKQEIDYIQNAQAALHALGDEDNITDLALALDYQLKHLLIDEFQDTSITQLRLIEKLTFNWQEDDGRTVFIVGDPMQSIYRFREADVGLFLHVWEQGLQGLRLNSITLSSNFRSQDTLIKWINQTFADAFPSDNDINTGAVRFTPAEAIKNGPGQVVFHHTYNAGQTIVDIIEAALKQNPKQSIAILVRAKTHLLNIIPELKKANIAYQAVEIEQLNTRSILYDALALTKALSHLADRTAWLSLLKAPFCGLALTDLTQLEEQACHHLNVWDTLKTADISEDGMQRLQFIRPILTRQLQHRRRKNLSEWIAETWQALQADRYYSKPHHQRDLESFLSLLDEQAEGGDIHDWKTLETSIEKLTAASENNEATIEIMTLHKAKGLEFDTVILPELQRRPNQNSHQLLLWQERILASDQSDLLLAPIKSKSETSSEIYDFLKYTEELKLQHEVTRLFYVACTRAKSHLHLLAALEEDENKQLKPPDPRSLLATIWNSCYSQFKPTAEFKTPPEKLSLQSKRFTSAAFSTPTAPCLPTIATRAIGKESANPPPRWEDNTPRIIGTVVHRMLQNIAEQGLSWWETINKVRFIEIQLQLTGLPLTLLAEVSLKIITILENVLRDEKALWILSPHPQHYCEYAISGNLNGEVIHAVIDRFFIDNADQGWIIDYKIILSDALDLRAKAESYAQQLKDYQLLLSNLYNQEIRIALYFPIQKVFLSL